MRVYVVFSHSSIFPDISLLSVKLKDYTLLYLAQSSSSPGPTYLKGTIVVNANDCITPPL